MVGDALRLNVLTRRRAGGVAVATIEGARRLDLLLPWLRDRHGRPLDRQRVEPDRPLHVRLVDSHGAIDDVLFVDRPAIGQSELHVHASDAVLLAIEALFGPIAAAPATDVWQRLLREASTPAQLALALEQIALGGEAAAAAAFVSSDGDPVARAAFVARSRIAAALSRPTAVVLIGSRNAGKSTLFNALLGQERSLTSAEPGATRDPVACLVVLDGYPYRLIDTAGAGIPVDTIEAMAQARGVSAAAGGGLVVRVVDGSQPDAAVGRSNTVPVRFLVCNKRDLGLHPDWCGRAEPTMFVSALVESGHDALRREFGARLRAARGLPTAPRRGVGGVASLDLRDSFES